MNINALRYYFNSLITLLRGLKNPGVMWTLLFKGSTSHPVGVVLHNGLSFGIFSLMDLWVLKETILDRQYEWVSLPLKDGWTIIDIGAALGDYSVWAADQTPHGRLIAVEPYPPSVTLLRANLQANHIKNVDVFAGAVASRSGITRLAVDEGRVVQNSTANSAVSDRAISVETISLDELLTRFGIEHCDYLKMDCEGGEYEILFTAAAKTLKRFDRICMEVHDGMTEHNRDEMAAFLERAGYTVRVENNSVHQELAYLYAEKTNLEEEHS